MAMPDRKMIQEELEGAAAAGADPTAAGSPALPPTAPAPPEALPAPEGAADPMAGADMGATGIMPVDMTPEQQEEFKRMLALAARQDLAGI